MKILRHTIILIFIAAGLLFARTARDFQKVDSKNLQVKSKHYWVKDCSEDNQSQLDRKRTHKKRRKIRKPVKGLR
jgi:hypothetical protein